MKRRGFLGLLAAPFVAMLAPKKVVEVLIDQNAPSFFHRVPGVWALPPEMGADGGYLVPPEFAEMLPLNTAIFGKPIRITNELLADSAVDLEAFVAQRYGEAFARGAAESDKLLRGPGNVNSSLLPNSFYRDGYNAGHDDYDSEQETGNPHRDQQQAAEWNRGYEDGHSDARMEE